MRSLWDVFHIESKEEKAVEKYLETRDHAYLKRVFDVYAKYYDHSKTKLIKSKELRQALIDKLEVEMNSDQVERLIESMDLDENGGLDFEEFKLAVQQPPTELEQWVATLPINGMLARSLPIRDSQGEKMLRNVSVLGNDGIKTTVNVFSKALEKLLMKARDNLRQTFDIMDDRASEANAGGVSASPKFQTFKMSTGNIQTYMEGLSSRIGTLPLATLITMQ
jgi:hypothetical protein